MKKRILVWLLAMLILFPLFPAFTAEAAYNEVDTRPYSRAVLSMNKTELDKVGRQTESGPCGCYALAYCRTILDGYAHSWTEFDGSGTHESSKAWASWTSGTYTPEFPNEGQKDLAFQLLYQSITNGKPAIVKVTFPNSQHYVAVVGYENVTRHGPLSAANFLILDSAASTRNVYNMAELNYDILAQNGCYQVVLSSSDESVGFSSSTPMDEEPPVVSDIFTAGMGYGDSGVTGFTLTFDVTDNVGVTQCWCDVWEYGKESEARHLPVTVSGNQGRVNVNLADFNTNTGLFLARAYAYDVAGNQSLISQLDLNSALSFFSSKADKKYIATYKVKADGTAYYIAPSKTYNGKTTCVGSLSKDRKVSTVGVVNADAGNDAWLELEDGTWIRYGDVTRCNWWTNLIDTIKNFFDTYVFVWNRQLVTGNTKVTLNAITYTAANTGGDGPITPTVTPCIVSFDGNGGTVPTLSNTAFPGSSFGSLPTPSRFGYSFDGWFTAADGGSQITSDSVCSGDITLYAHWTRIILSQGSCGDNLTYIHYGDGILEIIGSGDMTSHPWESHKVRVLEVYLPDGLTSICNDAFNGCQYLEEINIPDNVTSIGNMAFAFTGLTSLTLPNQIEYLGYGILWANTGVKELSIPKTLSSIGTTSRWIDAEPFGHIYAAVSVLSVSHVERLIFESGTTEIFNCFAQRSYYLKEVVLPDTVTKIGNSAFEVTTCLETINIPDSVISIGNYAFAETGLTQLTLPRYVEHLGHGILWGSQGVKEITIPKTVLTVSQESRWIDQEPYGHIYGPVGVLAASYVEKLVFEPGSTYIPHQFAQHAAYLNEVIIPDTVTQIDYSAFESCVSLTTLTIPDSVTTIGNYAFAENGLTQLTLPRYVEHLGHGILWGTQDVKEITIPKTVLTVSQESRWIDQEPYGNIYGSVGVLSASYVEKLVFEPGSTYIPHQIAQHAAYLKEVIIPDTVTQIDYSAFDSCVSLTTLTIPNSVTTIGNSVFSNSALAELAIPDSVTTIGNYAFAYTQLTQLTLPRYLEHLGIGVLWGNNGVKELTIPKTLKSSGVESRWIDMEPFGSVYADVGALSLSSVETLIFEAGTATILDRIAQRDVNLKEVTIPETVNTIGSSAFVCCYQLESITIPESVTTIKSYAFAGSGLKSAEIPDSVTNFNEGAFQDCSALASVKLPAHIADIPMNCFARCSALQRIEMPEPVQTIKESAFVDCGALAEIVWSNAPKQIEANAFRNCDSLTAVTFPATVTTIGNRSFQDCDLLVSVTLPDSVTSLGTSSFYNCHALTEVKLGNGLTAIPASAFEHCDVLESIVIPYRVSSIGAKAFKDCVAFREITIPRATTTIASDAFSYYDKLTIYGVPGTYAETYANEKGINFVGREVNATAVVLSETTMTLCKGQNAKLLFTAEPANFTDEVVWRSSNTSVATIADDGTVKAVDLGTATIKLMVGNVSVNCRVTVVQPVTRINLNNSSITMQALDTFQLTMTVTPSNAYNKEIVWSSSDENVATVDETGLVTALKKGTAKITAAAQDGSGKTASCTVTVSNSATICRTVEEFESPHNYPNNCSDFWVYTYAGAEELAVSFDGRTEMEEDFDFLRIFDGAGSMIGEYTGTALAGQTVTVSGDTVRIQIVSDSAGSTWGFKVSAVRRTAVETLTLPADLTAIESEAFAGLAQPVNVEIPEGVTSIAEDAFKDSDVTIVAKADSYAIAWAQEHNVPFVIDDD